MRFQGKGVVVTGGGSGIGLAAVQRFGAEGARVFVIDQNGDALAGVQAAHGPVIAGSSRADVSKSAEVRDAFASAATALGGVDVVVSNAGIYDVVPFLELTEERWDRVLAVDLKGMFLVGQTAARLMKRGGAIVNTASTSGLVASGAGPSAHYNAAKAGVISLTKQMAVELASLAIRVNAVCPGIIDTPMLPPAERTSNYLSSVPLGRLGRAEEIAGLIAFLASDEAAYVTGEYVVIDGGLTLGH